MSISHTNRLVAVIVALGLSAAATTVDARVTLKSICRVKGQEENTLHGLGFVVGLNGTGDGGNFLPTIRSLAKAMSLMGEPLGAKGLLELKDAKNVALVSVSVTVPAAGARQGDRLDCTVSSIGSATSLDGGQLFLTPLLGPDPKSTRVYGFAKGPISLDDEAIATTGKIFTGCQLEADFFNVFVKDDRVTLVIDKNHADFQVSQDIAELVNSQLSFQSSGETLAKAIDQSNVVVTIPPQYRDDPVLFISQILSLPMLDPQTEARVVINERAGTIVIGGDVEIGSVVVTHKNVTIETGAAAGAEPFVPLDPEEINTAKLKALVQALNTIHVSTADMIDIIKGLDRDGKLHGKLIIE